MLIHMDHPDDRLDTKTGRQTRHTGVVTSWSVPPVHSGSGSWCPPKVDREQHEEADATFRRVGWGEGWRQERI